MQNKDFKGIAPPRVFRCAECNDEYDRSDIRYFKKEGLLIGVDFIYEKETGHLICPRCVKYSKEAGSEVEEE